MITINLYDYKRIVRDVGIQKHLTMVVAVGMITFLLSCGIWMFQTMWIWGLKIDLADVEGQVVLATPNYNAVQKLQKQQKKYLEIISGINTLRSNQAPTTQLLEDVGQSIPDGIWLTSIEQMNLEKVENKKVPFLFIDYSKKQGGKKKGKDEIEDIFIQFKGTSKNDQSIIHFLEQLRVLPYIDAVVLHSSNRKWVENVPVQKFEIYCHFLKPEPAA